MVIFPYLLSDKTRWIPVSSRSPDATSYTPAPELLFPSDIAPTDGRSFELHLCQTAFPRAQSYEWIHRSVCSLATRSRNSEKSVVLRIFFSFLQDIFE